MDSQDLQQIVELCDEALQAMRDYDTYGSNDGSTPTSLLGDIIKTALDGKSLNPELRKHIAIKDQGRLISAIQELGFSSWHTGQLYEHHSSKVYAVRRILQSNIERLNALKTDIPHVVFYSWQSDLDGRFNRNFIEDAIDKAIKNVARDGQVIPRIDQGADDTAGSQSLHATILRKIETCGVFVADVSIVSGQGGKHCNSNVIYELGYATHCLGEDRVLLVCNTATGEIEDLPFDIKHKYVVGYKLAEGDDKAPVRNRLAAIIEDKIRPIFTK